MKAACDGQTADDARSLARQCRDALHADPRNADALHRLGMLAHLAGANDAAHRLIARSLVLAPRRCDFHTNLGIVLLGLRRFAEAEAEFRAAIRIQPDNFPARANLGVALKALDRNEEAIKAHGAALRLKPDDPVTLCNRALAFQAAWRYDEARTALVTSLRSSPHDANTHRALGDLLRLIGHPAEALTELDAAIRLRPEDAAIRQSRVMTMNYVPNADMASIGAAARAVAPAASGARFDLTGYDRDTERCLRVGYVSGDFKNHPVGYFLESTLAAMDRTQCEVFCYNNGAGDDAMTTRLKALADGWRDIAGVADSDVTRLIRADCIDILVDLSGHTLGSRHGVFAQIAAPVQAAWLGYFGTTGLAAMDFIIADRHVAPPGEEAHFSERVVRLPDSYVCFTPPMQAGPVAPLPAGADGPITFGCFNNFAKLNPAVIALWARVLAAVPCSRLFLKAAQYQDKGIRRAVTADFAAHGIGPERLLFEPVTPLAEMFAAYGRVDIALDPFPFGGGATTALALWMGVPVISFAGKTWTGRQGVSLLTAAGFPELVAQTPDAYVATARVLAQNRDGLAAFRLLLRDRMAASPLCQADRFARHLADAFRFMWRHQMQTCRAAT